jgi:methylthioribose-1-phosphate isomerase
MFELERLHIDATLIADSAAASLMAANEVDLVIVGADRIAANGDVANKVGTYALAVLARHHGIPFYVAAPTSTIDRGTATGAAICIEERDPDEVRTIAGRPIAPAGAAVRNPAFDVTPARLVTAIVTEVGVARRPFGRSLPAHVRRAQPTWRG